MTLVLFNSTADASQCCGMEIVSASIASNGANCFDDGSGDGSLSCEMSNVNAITTDGFNR